MKAEGFPLLAVCLLAAVVVAAAWTISDSYRAQQSNPPAAVAIQGPQPSAPPDTVPVRAAKRECEPASPDPASRADEPADEDPPSWWYSYRNPTLRDDLDGREVRDINALIASARVIERERDSELRSARLAYDAAVRGIPGDPDLWEQMHERREQAWTTYRERIESLVRQEVRQ